MTATPAQHSHKLYWLLIALCLLPWFALQSQLSLNGDAAWLMTATDRLLSGETMSAAYYEVNPPLSILYHIPPALLGKLLPIPDHYIIFLYFTGLIALSTLAINAILKRWDFIRDEQRFVILAAYLAANTVFTTIALGERDHIVLLGLMPFLLVQLSMTWGYTLPRKLLWACITFGVLAVLIKPHFGLLPTLLLVHRMKVQKRFFSIIKDRDFLTLAVGTLTYIAFVWLFFRDFITVILPDALDLYISNKDYQSALPELLMHTYLFLTFLGIEVFFTPLKDRSKKFLILLYAAALFGLVPYAVQMKGFYYQLIPAMAFFFCAFALSLQSYAKTYLSTFKYLGPALVIIIFALAYTNRPLLLTYPKHNDYKNLPLSKQIAQCDAPCPYFIFHSSIEIVHPTAFYDDQHNASRFPTFWFLPELAKAQYSLANGLPANLTQEQIYDYRDKYGGMVAEDLEHYNPKMLLIGQYRLTPDESDFDFPAFFEINDAFRQAWAQYEKIDRITFNRKPYFASTALEQDHPLTYNIYMKK